MKNQTNQLIKKKSTLTTPIFAINGKTAVLPKYSDSFIHIINKKVQKLDSSPSIYIHSNPESTNFCIPLVQSFDL